MLLSFQEKSYGHFYLFIVTNGDTTPLESGSNTQLLCWLLTPHVHPTSQSLMLTFCQSPLPSKHFFISVPRGFLLVFFPHKWIIMILYNLLNCLSFNLHMLPYTSEEQGLLFKKGNRLFS